MAFTSNDKRIRDRDPALTWAVPPALEELCTAGAQAAPQDGGTVAAAGRAAFSGVAHAHLEALVHQLLVAEGVGGAEVWGPIVVKLAQQAASSLSPMAMTANGTMDPRQYVKVKRVVGEGDPTSSSVVQGVVFRKNVAHKRMRTSIPQAGIMLLAGALEWQPTESKLQQFDALLSEEQAFLQAGVERIASFSPDVLVVERSVARYAQELLLDKDVALVLNVKRELLDRIARCTDAEVVPSLAQLNAHSLGFCKEFEVQSLSPAGPAAPAAAGPQLSRLSRGSVPSSGPGSPTAPPAAPEQGHLVADAATLRRLAVRGGPNSLMLFKGCPRPLGCTILLHGSDPGELSRVKRVAGFAAYAAYWNRLEAELLADGLASAAAAAALLERGSEQARQERTSVEQASKAQPEEAATVAAGSAEEPLAAVSAVAPPATGKCAASSWAAVAAACAEASASAAAEQRGHHLIISPSPHVTFVGCQDQGGAGTAGQGGQQQPPMETGRSPANTGTAASAASSPTKSIATAAAIAATSSLPTAPSSLSAAASEREQAVMQSLLLAEDSCSSDPWVVPADGDSATVTISGHASVCAAGSEQQLAASSPLMKSPSSLSLPAAGASTQLPDSPQLDPLSRAAREIELRLAAEEATSSSDDEEGSGGGESAAAETHGGGSEQELVAPGVPYLAHIHTRSGTPTADSSPKTAHMAAQEPAAVASSTASSVYSSQQLWVSISCKNPAKGILCEPPHTHCMQYYARDDMPLAHFLAAATPTHRKCPHPACGEGAMLHLRSFMHGDGLVTLSSVRLPAGQELPGQEKGQIWLWLRPLGKDLESQGDVRRVALSAEGACMSFAHLLNLLLDARYLTLDDNSLQREFVCYLGSGSTVLCLHHSQVLPYTVRLPPRKVGLSLDAEAAWLLEEVKGLTEEGDEAFGAIQYALAQQLQPVEEEDPEFVATWMSNLGDTRASFMELVQAARAGLDQHLMLGGVQDGEGLDQEDLVQAVWELNRLRRLLTCEVLQWATALHEGTPVARAAPPQTVTGSLSGSLGRHSRHGSMDADAAREQQQPLPSGLACSTHKEGPSPAQVPREDGAGAGAASLPAAGGLPPLPPESRPRAAALSETQTPAAAAAAPPAASAVLPGPEQPQERLQGRASPSHMRRSSVSLGQHIQSSMPLRAGPSTSLLSSSANYAPSLRDGEGGAPALEPATSSGLEPAAPIPIGLVARYISMFDDGTGSGRPHGEVRPHSPAQQRTFDWVQRASPSFTDSESAQSAPASFSQGSVGGAGPGGRQQPVGQSPAGQPESHYVCLSDEEDAGLGPMIAGLQESGSTSEGMFAQGAQAAVERLRRPSIRIDLSRPDPELVSALTPRAAEPADGGDQPRGTQTAFERLASRFGRLSLRRSLSERRRNGTISPSGSTSRTVGFATGDEQARIAAPGGESPQPPACGMHSADAEVAAPHGAAQVQPARTLAAVHAGSSAGEKLPAAEPVEVGPPAAELLHGTGVSGELDGSLVPSTAPSASHFDEWSTLLKSAGSGALGEVEEAVAEEPSQQPSIPVPIAIPASPHRVDLASAASSPAMLPSPRAHLPMPSSSAAPQLLPHPSAPATAGSAPAELPPQRQPSKLKQLLGKLRLEPQAGQLPLATGKVELTGRTLLPPGLDDMQVTIFDEEPTSVIAYFLSTRVYHQYLRDAVASILYGSRAPHAQGSTAAQEGGLSGDVPPSWQQSGPSSSTSEPGAATSAVDPSAAAGTSPQPQPGGKSVPSRSADWQVLFSEQRLDCQLSIEDMSPGMPWGRAKFQVVAFYAPQFAELRRRCVAGGEAAFLASISRCRKWASRGGKSNVYFAKTRDDRYIVKQLSKSERQSFLEFAPDYFRYVATMLHKGQDTCLGKILGMYQVSVKYANSSSAPFAATVGVKDGMVDLLIMENIFYGRSISRIYDLKGSERDRYVADNPGVAGAVLLDENLKEMNLSSPTLVGPGDFAKLQRALWSDTAFLSSLGVMDYSLLVGIDRQRQELVVGVIDFIRQYTWDKQVETWVKKSGILGGAGKDPTVISPKQYSRRFRVAISGYITVVPSLQAPPPPLDPDAV